MANRKDLPIIRAARAGNAAAQLRLGKQYLSGTGLPRNLPTALYWLDRAARQDEAEAWLLIGREIPYETVLQTARPAELCIWYERAFDAGQVQAGFVMARLVLGAVDWEPDHTLRSKALQALQASASAGIAEAQWLLARYLQLDLQGEKAWALTRAAVCRPDGGSPTTAVEKTPASPMPARRRDDRLPGLPALSGIGSENMLNWVRRAAQGGIWQAKHALAEHAWSSADRATFLCWALPLARELAGRIGAVQDAADSVSQRRLRAPDISLLSRCAQALLDTGHFAAEEILQFRECAAQAGDRLAQYSLGLWFARMDDRGKRAAAIPGVANYRKAIRWLSLAAAQGLGDACYALSKIHLKPECSQRNPAEAQRYLEQAAQAGHGAAQFELGIAAWRGRRERIQGDIQAAYWLQQAAAQGIEGAQRMLDKVAAQAIPAAWARTALERMPREAAGMYPLLVARIELAASFGLARTEALLINLREADYGHCLLVDIRAWHPHGRRRLIRLQTAEERRLLDRLLVLFGKAGEEGNYRQRLYRLKMLTSDGGKMRASSAVGDGAAAPGKADHAGLA